MAPHLCLFCKSRTVLTVIVPLLVVAGVVRSYFVLRQVGDQSLAITSIFALTGEQHICRSQCHNGPCPPCTKSRVVQCIECKDKVRVDCKDLKQTEEYIICGKCFKPCNKVKNCGRHWCYKHKCQVCTDGSLVIGNIEFFINYHLRYHNHHTCVIRCAINDLDVVNMIVTNPTTVENVKRVLIQVSNTLVW